MSHAETGPSAQKSLRERGEFFAEMGSRLNISLRTIYSEIIAASRFKAL